MKLKKSLTVLAIVFSICSNGIAKEKIKPLVSCDLALGACEEYVKTFDAERKSYMNVIAKQDEKLNELLSKPEPIAWYWFVLGGVVAGAAISKTMR